MDVSEGSVVSSMHPQAHLLRMQMHFQCIGTIVGNGVKWKPGELPEVIA